MGNHPSGCSDGLVAAHIPHISLNYDGSFKYSLAHPQIDTHYIDWISAVDENGQMMWWMELPQPMTSKNVFNETMITFDFTVDGLPMKLQPYENCNLHGLWTGDALDVGLDGT